MQFKFQTQASPTICTGIVTGSSTCHRICLIKVFMSRGLWFAIAKKEKKKSSDMSHASLGAAIAIHTIAATFAYAASI